MNHLLHLAKRFVGSLSPLRPPRSQRRWVRSILRVGEWALWCRMSAADQRHSIKVASLVMRAGLAEDAIAAALLHDIGKIEAQLGTFSRALTTMLASGLGRGHIARWTSLGGYRRRMALYICHDQVGSALLQKNGARQLAISWARSHHGAVVLKPVPPEIAKVLQAADCD